MWKKLRQMRSHVMEILLSEEKKRVNQEKKTKKKVFKQSNRQVLQIVFSRYRILRVFTRVSTSC